MLLDKVLLKGRESVYKNGDNSIINRYFQLKSNYENNNCDRTSII